MIDPSPGRGLIEIWRSTAPTVTRAALQNAASIASLMLTTEAMIADATDDKGGDHMGGMPGGMGDMGMGM